MLEIEELSKVEDKLKVRYSTLSKLFAVIAILFIIWVFVVLLGIYLLGQGYNWALLSLDNWIYVLCVLIGFFVVLEIIFYLHYNGVSKKRLEAEKPEPEFTQGKRLYVYTHPKGAEGGIYSKTYIKIDENNVLRLRALIIPPQELWGAKEEK
jgi:hypothetical protein